MLELGEKSKEEHEKVTKKAIETKPGLMILVGEEMRHGYEMAVKAGFTDVKYICSHDEKAMNEAAEMILAHAHENDVVLLKASHGIALERIVPIIVGGTGSMSDKLIVPEFLPDRFESGTLNLPGIIGLRTAILHINDVGIKGIYQKKMEYCLVKLKIEQTMKKKMK